MTRSHENSKTRIDGLEREGTPDPLNESRWTVDSHRTTGTVEQKNPQLSANEPEIDERRRAVVGGLAAITGLSGLSFPRLPSVIDYNDFSAPPHTEATFEALVDAAVPRTPALADERGAEHEPGGLDVHLERYIIWSLNHLLGFPTTSDLADEVAQQLDQGAEQLIEREENEDPPTVDEFPEAGLFGELHREDRFRAIDLLEDSGVTLMILVNLLVHFGYYSEWSGYENNTGPPTDRTFTGEVQSWEQTKFPGPAVGYRDFRGYLVEEFEDDDSQGEDSEGGDSP